MIARQGALLFAIIFLAFITGILLVNFLSPGQFSPGNIAGSPVPSPFLITINNVRASPTIVNALETLTVSAEITLPFSDQAFYYVCKDSNCNSFYCTSKSEMEENIEKTLSCSFVISSKLKGIVSYYVKVVSDGTFKVVGPYSFTVRSD